MIANAFNNRRGAGIAYGETFACDSVQEDFATGSAVENDVADEDAFFRQEDGVWRVHDDASAGESFAEVIVGVAFEFRVTPLGTNAPKLWPAEPSNLK